ncbi:anti-sigma factor [Bacillus weihaiensis]|uniref:Anti-sigma-W factor RsiW n=1 Tax=Bacillus weihaiensis TaxID=1547283 RepID=A0A1L3MUV5_9BACI|nr:anti-sigma factor [Bacillus weihaiensis]APH06113.1 hypothetical protein A9C19_15955 [Bacillus weihaiensis]
MNNEACYNLIDYYNRTLTKEEMQKFEQHLSTCSECQSELEELTMLTEDLPFLSEPVEVPKEMKARIFAEIFEEEQDAKVIDFQPKTDVEPVKTKRSRFIMPTIAAALLVSLITNIYLLTERNEKPIAESGEMIQASQVTLLPTTEGEQAVAIASLLNEEGNQSLLLQASNLPTLSENEVYQVWVIEGEQPYPAGAFQPNDSGQGTLTYSLEEVEGKWDTIAITVEKEENLPVPAGEIVLAGKL